MTDDNSNTLNRTEKLHSKICKDVQARSQWYERQRTFYRMRHDGLRRKQKPWPWAADMHYPLCDTTIDKLKPFYFSQLFGTEVIAQFVAKLPEVAPLAQEAGYWFDFKLKQETNLEEEILFGADRMLQAGHGVLKVGWDADQKRLFFDSFEPTHVIVPESTQNLREADRVCFVHHFSEESYLRDDRFTEKAPDFVARIKGDTADTGASENGMRQDKEIREGITHTGKDDDTIIIWEVWVQTATKAWEVHFFSPQAPERPVRKSQGSPFLNIGLPAVRFDFEKKEKGHYASRGVVEIQGPFETSICATWNAKLDAMTLYNTPRFTSDRPIPNTSNMRFTPGQILPGNVQPVQSPNRPPISFDDEMNSTSGVAERRIGVPDYGIGQANDKNEARTAHEVVAIGQQQSMSVDLRSRTFRMALGELLQIAWGILVQNDQGTLYYVASEVKKLPPNALAFDAWMVKPNGSSETWNKGAQFQRAVARYQMFGPSQGYPQGSPYVNQGELTKSVLEIDDPRIVSRLFQDPNAKARTEYEDESALIPAMLEGAQFQPRPEQDQAARIKAVMDFIKAKDATGKPLDPHAIATLQQRAQANMQMLQQKSPQQAAQVQQGIAAEAQNVIQMPPDARSASLPASAEAGAAPQPGA